MAANSVSTAIVAASLLRKMKKYPNRAHWGDTNPSKRPEVREKIRLSKLGAKNPMWKGNTVSYAALHAWVERTLGKPKKCTECGIETRKKYEWANLSGKYLRDIKDWKRLCVPCHDKLDSVQKKGWNTRRKIK